MLDFKEITLADKQWIDPLLRLSGFGSEEYNFTFLYIWRGVFGLSAARCGDYLIIKSTMGGRAPAYYFPAGSGDIAPVMAQLEADAAASGAKLRFALVLGESRAQLETLYPGRFGFTPQTDYYDYVYDAGDLITLAGKKLHAKRNHIHRFRENCPDWRYEPITPDNLPEVALMNSEWCRQNGCERDKSLLEESCATREAIREFFALGLDGGLIRTGGRVVAFSMGDRLNADTYLVHIEKAFGDIQGAYAAINQEFASHCCEGYLYINREDDSGQEGLRKAKQSYRPVFKVEKFSAISG